MQTSLSSSLDANGEDADELFPRSFDSALDILGFGDPFKDSMNQKLQSLCTTDKKSLIE